MQTQSLPAPTPATVQPQVESASGPWFALYVRPNAEQSVVRQLREKGYSAFTPTYRLRKRWSDRTVETERACFPSYAFCRFDPEIKSPVVSTPGVIRVVGFGKSATALPEAEVEGVRRLSESLIAMPHPFLRIGQRVTVRSGPLAGAEGFLVKFKRACRLVVAISMLERAVAAEIDIADVRPA